MKKCNVWQIKKSNYFTGLVTCHFFKRLIIIKWKQISWKNYTYLNLRKNINLWTTKLKYAEELQKQQHKITFFFLDIKKTKRNVRRVRSKVIHIKEKKIIYIQSFTVLPIIQDSKRDYSLSCKLFQNYLIKRTENFF